LVVLADAGVGELKLVLNAADPAAQIYLCACGQKPDVARAGLESAVEFLVRLRAAEDHTTHVISLSRSLVRGPFSLLALMRIKMEPRRCKADGIRPQVRRRPVITPAAIAARN
jgi:hypothetical protein